MFNLPKLAEATLVELTLALTVCELLALAPLVCKLVALALTICELRALFLDPSQYVYFILLLPCGETLYKLGSLDMS